VLISIVATIILLISSWNRPSAWVEEALGDLERQRIPVKAKWTKSRSGTRKNPLNYKNTHAAITRSNECQEVIWARVKKHLGVWQIFPGGAVIHWPERETR
jgi:hypothetical protein